MSAWGIVLAGGSGERFGRPGGKQLLTVCDRPLAWWSIAALAAASEVEGVIVACHPERVDEYAEALADACHGKPLEFVAGGATRQDSARAAILRSVEKGATVVAIHDGARPLVTAEDVDAVITATCDSTAFDGFVLGHPCSDTLKRVDGQTVVETPDRSAYWQVQTPQVFGAQRILRALESADSAGFIGTDDASIIEFDSGTVGVVRGRRDNIKVTLPEDAVVAELVLMERAREERSR
jgi:2-C-methyl-D-erythritol 4-phosphate cytidylyltransferase